MSMIGDGDATICSNIQQLLMHRLSNALHDDSSYALNLIMQHKHGACLQQKGGQVCLQYNIQQQRFKALITSIWILALGEGGTLSPIFLRLYGKYMKYLVSPPTFHFHRLLRGRFYPNNEEPFFFSWLHYQVARISKLTPYTTISLFSIEEVDQ